MVHSRGPLVMVLGNAVLKRKSSGSERAGEIVGERIFVHYILRHRIYRDQQFIGLDVAAGDIDYAFSLVNGWNSSQNRGSTALSESRPFAEEECLVLAMTNFWDEHGSTERDAIFISFEWRNIRRKEIA